jgi:hypothetical protein
MGKYVTERSKNMTQVQTREKHIVIFHSPGTFVDETSECEVQSFFPSDEYEIFKK